MRNANMSHTVDTSGNYMTKMINSKTWKNSSTKGRETHLLKMNTFLTTRQWWKEDIKHTTTQIDW